MTDAKENLHLCLNCFNKIMTVLLYRILCTVHESNIQLLLLLVISKHFQFFIHAIIMTYVFVTMYGFVSFSIFTIRK